MTNRLYLYVLGPIDDWTEWIDAEKHLASLEEGDREWRLPFVRAAQRMIVGARYFERETHTYPWFIAPLPGPEDGSCAWMVATKITNNGTTFLVSPYELPWLGEAE